MNRSGTRPILGALARADEATDSESVAASSWNRRSSAHVQAQPRFPQDSYYGSRPPSFRADSSYGAYAPGPARGNYHDGGHGGGYGRANARERTPRMHSEGHYQTYGREQNVYPMPHKDRSYETVTSAAQSGSSDPAGYHTDPTSSDNSSIDRASPAKRQEPTNDYGIGFSQPQAYQAGFSVGPGSAGGAGGQAQHALPPPPVETGPPEAPPPGLPRKQSVLRRQVSRQESPEKRKSWFGRRFSKS